MTCREIQEKMPDFVKNQMSLKEAEGFIKHVKGCPECMEELEVNHVLYSALQQLEDDTDFNGNYMEELHKHIAQTEQKIRRKFRYEMQIKFSMVLLAIAVVCVLAFPYVEHWLWTKQVPQFGFDVPALLLNDVPNTEMPERLWDFILNSEENRRRYEEIRAEEKRLQEREEYFKTLMQRIIEEQIQREIKERLEQERLDHLLQYQGVPSHNSRIGKNVEYTK